jgi:ADP-heptose:LPS heptosyltransferase
MQHIAPKTLNVLLIRSSSIGDVILATATLQYLKSLDIPLSIFWLGREPALELIRKSYPDITCLTMKSGLADNFALVRTLPKIDVVVDMQVNLRSIGICLSAWLQKGARIFWCKKKGFARSWLVLRARFRRRGVPREREETTHQYQLMLSCVRRALSHFLAKPPTQGEFLPALHAESEALPQAVRQQLAAGKWIAVAPGAAHIPKQAPEAIFEKILKATLAKKGSEYSVVFLGEAKDRAIAESIAESIVLARPSVNLCGDLTLWQSICALSFCDSALGNDTSLCHAAQALGIPTAILFGPTVEEFGFSAWGAQSKSFSFPLGCRPCSKHGKIPCRYGDYLCFSGIEKQAVANFLSSHLG